MAVLLETSKGDLVIDLYTDECPQAARNFLKLCKIKYYNNVLFHNVQQNFIVQTGDPTGTGKGGSSIDGVLYGEQARFFPDEIRPHLKHKAKGMVGMAAGGKDMNASQFYITTGEELDSLDEKHTLFGEVSEGLDVLMAINDAFVDGAGIPIQNIRIRHTIVLEDPFPDPAMLADHIPEKSPEPEYTKGDRLEDDWAPSVDQRPLEEIEESSRKQEARNRAVVLEMIGDLPEADAAPPANMLFICKLNQVTSEEDLDTIFSRFGTITSCDIIKDFKTGDSLCYAFLGFDNNASCEEAYFKMNNVLIDDRRIKVDFSQSVSHLWKQFRRFGSKGDAAAGDAAAAHAGGGGGAGGRACYNCGEPGHMAAQCPNPKTGSGRGGQGGSAAGGQGGGGGGDSRLEYKGAARGSAHGGSAYQMVHEHEEAPGQAGPSALHEERRRERRVQGGDESRQRSRGDVEPRAELRGREESRDAGRERGSEGYREAGARGGRDDGRDRQEGRERRERRPAGRRHPADDRGDDGDRCSGRDERDQAPSMAEAERPPREERSRGHSACRGGELGPSSAEGSRHRDHRKGHKDKNTHKHKHHHSDGDRKESKRHKHEER